VVVEHLLPTTALFNNLLHICLRLSCLHRIILHTFSLEIHQPIKIENNFDLKAQLSVKMQKPWVLAPKTVYAWMRIRLLYNFRRNSASNQRK